MERYVLGLLTVPLVATAVLLGNAFGGKGLAAIMCVSVVFTLGLVLLPGQR